MRRLVIDLDHTICWPQDDADQAADPRARYAEARPNPDVIDAIRRYKADGFEIVLFTARNMRTYAGDLDRIRAHTLPVILDWLGRHDVPFDEVMVGKPWCGTDGFYVDDRAVRPSEFAAMSFEEITALLHRERHGGHA